MKIIASKFSSKNMFNVKEYFVTKDQYLEDQEATTSVLLMS
jgi:hypothetical protein